MPNSTLSATPFQVANYIEAAIWVAIGVGCLGRAMLPGRWRKVLLIAGFTLIAFGGSDVVETGTGAWWKPWWLLAWKAGCVVILVVAVGWYCSVRSRKSG